MKRYRFLALSVFLFACLALAFLDGTQAAQAVLPPAGEPISLNVERLGQIGGETTAVVAVQGHYAFTELDSRLVTLNISDPTHPIVVGQSEPFFTYRPSSLLLNNGVAYAAGGHELWVIDITNPLKPRPIAAHPVPGIAQRVVVDGHYAYVANETALQFPKWVNGGLQIFDIANPFHPVEVSFYETPAGVLDVAVAGHHAYLAHGQCANGSCAPGDLRILDVSDPASPAEVNSYPMTLGSPTRVAISNSRVYVLDTQDGCSDYQCSFGIALRVIDVSDPTALHQLGVFSPITMGNSWQAPGFGNLQIVDDLVYITNGPVLILDAANPANIVEVNNYYDYFGWITDIVFIDQLALTASGRAGLELFDVSDPAAITKLGDYNTPTNLYYVSLLDHYAYISAEDGAHIIDVAKPEHPQELGTLNACPDFCAAPSEIAGNYGYWAALSLGIVDVSDPATPVKVGEYTHSEWGRYEDIEVADEYAYSLFRTYGISETTWLQIIDISAPITPTLLTEYQLPVYHASTIVIAGDYAYISFTDGLLVFNILDPANPILVASYVLEGSLRGLVIAEGYLYAVRTLPDYTTSLWLLDISEPITPTLLSSFPLATHHATRPVVAGHHVYIGDAYRLRVIDFSEITAPVQVGYYQTEHLSYFHSLVVANHTVYSIVENNELMNLRFTADSHTVTPNSGATLVHTDTQGTNATITIAPGTVEVTTTLVYSQLPAGFIQPELALAGHAFDIVAYQDDTPLPELAFLQPITVTIHYSDSAIGVITDEAALELQWLQADSWLPAVTTCDPPATIYHDPTNNLIQIPICRTGRFAIFGPTNQTFLPFLP